MATHDVDETVLTLVALHRQRFRRPSPASLRRAKSRKRTSLSRPAGAGRVDSLLLTELALLLSLNWEPTTASSP